MGRRRRRRLLLIALFSAVSACAAPEALRPRAELAPDKLAAAERMRRDGRMEDAEAAYRATLGLDPDSVRAHAGLQVVQIDAGLDLEVRRAYRDGGGYLAGRLEGAERSQREAYENAQEPYKSLALGRYERARQLDAGHSWIRLAMARDLLADGELGRAAEEFLATLWSDPGNPLAAYGMSLIADRRGDYRMALAWATRAFENAPGNERIAGRLRGLAGRSGSKRIRERAAKMLTTGSSLSLLYAAELSTQHAAAYRERARRDAVTAAELAAAKRAPPAPAIAPFVRALVRGVRMRYRHFAAADEAESFDEFVAWARALYTRETGRPLGPPGKPIEYAFVGKLMDPSVQSDEPLVRACAAHGLLLILGQRSGGPPEALVGKIVKREGPGKTRVRGFEIEREVVWISKRYLSGYLEWTGSGDLAGLALKDLVIVDTNAVARWEGDLVRRRRRLSAHKDRILAQEALEDEPVTSVEDPAGVADRLRLVSRPELAAEILVHEDSHLVDAARHLPVGSHLFRNLGLAVKSGFSARRVLAFLERNAQLAAIVEGPDPLGALATCCATLGNSGPHATGYTEIVEGIVKEIAAHPREYEAIDTERVIVQQLHRLPAAQVRRAAQSLQRQWGLDEG